MASTNHSLRMSLHLALGFWAIANTTRTSSGKLAGVQTIRLNPALSSRSTFSERSNRRVLVQNRAPWAIFTLAHNLTCVSYFCLLSFTVLLGFPKPTYVTKDSKIKNRFALGIPSNCPIKLAHLYNDQLVALNEVVEFERKQDLLENKVYFLQSFIYCHLPRLGLPRKRMDYG